MTGDWLDRMHERVMATGSPVDDEHDDTLGRELRAQEAP